MSPELFVTLTTLAILATRVAGRLATYALIALVLFFVLSTGPLPAFATATTV